MSKSTITVVGVRGGHGASTIAAALALFAAGSATTELVAHDVGASAALLGLPIERGECGAIPVTEHLTLTMAPTGAAAVTVHDAGRLQDLRETPDGLLLGVLRGPCYLGLRTLVAEHGFRPDALVLVCETGRSLTRRDVTDVSGIEVVADVDVSAVVARSIDAGLLTSRLHRLRDLAALRTYATRLFANASPIDPLDPLSNSAPNPCTTSSPDTLHHPRTTIDKNVTDLSVPLHGTDRGSDACREWRLQRA